MCTAAVAPIYDLITYVMVETSELLRKILIMKISDQSLTYVDKVQRVYDTH